MDEEKLVYSAKLQHFSHYGLHDQQPEVATGANHEDDHDRKWLEDGGAACFSYDLSCEQTYLLVILIAFLI